MPVASDGVDRRPRSAVAVASQTAASSASSKGSKARIAVARASGSSGGGAAASASRGRRRRREGRGGAASVCTTRTLLAAVVLAARQVAAVGERQGPGEVELRESEEGAQGDDSGGPGGAARAGLVFAARVAAEDTFGAEFSFGWSGSEYFDGSIGTFGFSICPRRVDQVLPLVRFQQRLVLLSSGLPSSTGR